MLRGTFALAAAIMLGLWGWSLVPAIANWGHPNEDGFSFVPLFYTTLVCLPAALILLAGARSGEGRPLARARMALLVAGGLTVLVAAFLVVQQIANGNDGKVFGIQIGRLPSAASCA